MRSADDRIHGGDLPEPSAVMITKEPMPRDHFKVRVLEWVRLFTITGGAQLLVQALGFASGIIVIRLLNTQEYAFYTIANTMLGTMTVLSDGGIGVGVISQGGKVWKDPVKLGAIMAAGLSLRKQFAAISLLLATPAMIYLLRHHGASWTLSLLIYASLVPAFLAALSDSLLEVAPKLRQDIIPLQRNQIAAAIARLGFTTLFVFAFPWAAAGIFAAGIARIWANIRLRKIVGDHAVFNQRPDSAIQKEILKVVKRVLPTSIYYCISGQLTIWLLSVMGSTKAVGQIGALSGLSTMLNIFTVVFGTLMVPRFARLPSVKKIIVQRFLLLQLGLIILGTMIVLTTSLFSKQLLWILGSRFAGLRKELVLVAIQSCVGLASSSTNQLLSARGIIVPPAIFVLIAIAAQVGFALVVPLNQLVGALMYGILTGLSVYAIRLSYFGLTLAKHEYHQ